MRTLAILVAAVGLAGCASSPGLSSVMKTCGYNEKPFTDSWPCVRQGFAQIGGPADLKEVYYASGNYVAEQVATGKMTDTEAKLTMAQVRERLGNAEDARGNIPVGNAIVAASILNRPTGVQTAPSYVQRAPVNCYPVGNTVQCY